jgi:serine/threonine protein kinase
MKIKRNKLSYRKNKILGGANVGESIEVQPAVNDLLNLMVYDEQFSNKCLDFRGDLTYQAVRDAGQAISKSLFDILFKMKDVGKLAINHTTTLKGEGTYGKVYVDPTWYDTGTRDKYLLKEHISKDTLDSDGARILITEMIDEFKLGVKLLHGLDDVDKKYLSPSKYMVIYPNILPIFIVPDAGVSLVQARKERTFTFPDICKIGLDITKGLQIMHEHIESDTQGKKQKHVPIIHRDIKGDNIVLSLKGDGNIDHASIIDFGLSMNCTDGTPYDVNGGDINASTCGKYAPEAAVGTILWMAPEVPWEPPKPYDESVDIYSWACVMVELITGLIPWEKEIDNGDISLLAEGDPSIADLRRHGFEGIHPGKNCIDVYTLQLKLTGYNAVADKFRECITMAFGRVLYKTSPVNRPSAETIVDILESIHGSLEKGPCAVFKIVKNELTPDGTKYYNLHYTVVGAVDAAREHHTNDEQRGHDHHGRSDADWSVQFPVRARPAGHDVLLDVPARAAEYYDLHYPVVGAVDGAVDESVDESVEVFVDGAVDGAVEPVEPSIALGWFRYSALRAIYDKMPSTGRQAFPNKMDTWFREAGLVSWLNTIIQEDTGPLIPLYEFLFDLPKEL